MRMAPDGQGQRNGHVSNWWYLDPVSVNRKGLFLFLYTTPHVLPNSFSKGSTQTIAPPPLF